MAARDRNRCVGVLGVPIGAQLDAFDGRPAGKTVSPVVGDCQDSGRAGRTRAILPSLTISGDLREVLAFASDYDAAFLAYEGEAETGLKRALQHISETPARVLVIVGPEGGFSDTEVKAARKAGVQDHLPGAAHSANGNGGAGPGITDFILFGVGSVRRHSQPHTARRG